MPSHTYMQIAKDV